MKLKAVATLCTRAKKLYLADGQDGIQWLGDGSSYYSLAGLPKLDEDTLKKVLDIPSHISKKMYYENKPLPVNIWALDGYETENEVNIYGFAILRNGDTYVPINCSGGAVFIDMKYLKPVEADREPIKIIEYNEHNRTYILITSGLEVQAILDPIDFVTEDFCVKFDHFAKSCRTALAVQKIKTTNAHIDIETGEIIEAEEQQDADLAV